MAPEAITAVYGLPINVYLITMLASYGVFFVVSFVLGQERGMGWRMALDGALLGGGLALVLGAAITLLLQTTVLPELPDVWSFAQIGVLPLALAVYFSRHSVTRGRALRAIDSFVPALILTQAVFRVGCASAGCCHGKPAWGVPWAIVVDNPATDTIYRGIPVHPTQIYQILANLLVFVLLMALRKRPGFQGKLLWVYLVAYGLGRFVVEFYRGDPRPMVGALSVNQVVCLLFIGLGAAGWQGWVSADLWTRLGWRLGVVPRPAHL